MHTCKAHSKESPTSRLVPWMNGKSAWHCNLEELWNLTSKNYIKMWDKSIHEVFIHLCYNLNSKYEGQKFVFHANCEWWWVVPSKTPKTENQCLHGFEVHRPSSKCTQLLFQVYCLRIIWTVWELLLYHYDAQKYFIHIHATHMYLMSLMCGLCHYPPLSNSGNVSGHHLAGSNKTGC